MNGFQKMGGVAALIEAATYVVGFALLFTVLAPLASEMDPVQYVSFLAANHVLMYIWNLIIYVVNGVFLVILVLALYERLKMESPALAQTATAFGLIWSGLVIASGMLIINNMSVVLGLYETDPEHAASLWIALKAIEEGLGGGVELPGGLWVLLVSWAALQANALPRAVNLLGVTIGLAGILTLIPTLDLFEAVFGLGCIVWFAWVGIVLLVSRSSGVANERLINATRPPSSP